MHINSLDCNVPMLTLEDVAENGDDDQDVAIKTIFIQFIKLCQYMEGILSLHITESTSDVALQEQIDLCEDTLQRWRDHLPTTAQVNQSSKSPAEIVSSTYRAVLHMVYKYVSI